MSSPDELNPILTADTCESQSEQPSVITYYTLPFLRYRNLVLLVLFVDGVSTLAFWLTGGHTDYFVDSILHFHMTQSVFDLALMTSFKVVILWILFTILEDSIMAQVDDPYNQSLNRCILACHLTVILVTISTLGYALVKGGMILDAYLNNESFHHLHLTYNIACISCVAFGLLELILGLLSFRAMRMLKVQRILNRKNAYGQHLDEEGNVIKRKANIRRLLALAKPELPYILSAVFFLLISSTTETVSPLFFGVVVDAAVTSMHDLNHAVLILLAVYIVGAFATAFRAGLFTLAGQSLVARLRTVVFCSIIQQEVAFFDVTRTGELTNRLASDTTVIQNAVTVNISMLARYLLVILGSIGLMFYLNAALTGVLLAVIPIVTIGAIQYGRFLQSLQKRFQDQLADASTVAEENISSLRTVRSFSGEDKAGDMYSTQVERSFQTGKKLAIMQGAFQGFIGVFVSGAITLALWYGGKLVHEKSITAGVLTSFLLYSLQVALAFGILSSLYGDFMKAVGASVRIFDLMDRKPTVGTEENLNIPEAFDSSVEFRDVKFCYPSRPENQVLKGVSFSVGRGQMIALVGPSGGGKSTIVNLIQRFYDPDQGTVLLGGHNVKSLDLKYMRSKMSMVSQEPSLFACSIKDNITYGKEASSFEEIIAVAKQANAHDFIEGFESGYHTLVGEKGIRLSGGQKQRVAIARALMMDPEILLLDEATSALDAESEQQVQEAIDNAMKNRTVLVIAHRLSTVRNAHKILVLDQGEIVESGSHDQLVAIDGVYKRLVLRQLDAGQRKSQPEGTTIEGDE